MAVKCVALTTGQEIIGEVTEHDGGVTLGTPASIFLQPTKTGQVGVSLLPLYPYAEKKEFVLPATAVLAIFNPSRELHNEYNRIFGSGLVIPTIDLDRKQLIVE